MKHIEEKVWENEQIFAEDKEDERHIISKSEKIGKRDWGWRWNENEEKDKKWDNFV